MGLLPANLNAFQVALYISDPPAHGIQFLILNAPTRQNKVPAGILPAFGAPRSPPQRTAPPLLFPAVPPASRPPRHPDSCFDFRVHRSS